jgi:hypothetical protein
MAVGRQKYALPTGGTSGLSSLVAWPLQSARRASYCHKGNDSCCVGHAIMLVATNHSHAYNISSLSMIVRG